MLTIYPFRIEEYLKLPPMTRTYFKTLQEPGVLDVINRNRAKMEPFGNAVDEALLNLLSNLDAFPQKYENSEEIALIVNDLLDNKNPSDGPVLLEDTTFIESYSKPALILDDGLKIQVKQNSSCYDKSIYLVRRFEYSRSHFQADQISL